MANVPCSLSTAIEYLKRTRVELLLAEHALGSMSEAHYLAGLALIEQAVQSFTLATMYRMRGD